MPKARVVYNIAHAKPIPGSNPPKGQWSNIGVIIETSSGALVGSLNYMPTAVDGKPWDGRFNLFPANQPKPARGDAPPEHEGELDEPPF